MAQSEKVKVKLPYGGSLCDELTGFSIANDEEKWVARETVAHLLKVGKLIVVANIQGTATSTLDSEAPQNIKKPKK